MSIKCIICNTNQVQSIKGLKIHYKRCHVDQLGNLQQNIEYAHETYCFECNKQFVNKYVLQRHQTICKSKVNEQQNVSNQNDTVKIVEVISHAFKDVIKELKPSLGKNSSHNNSHNNNTNNSNNTINNNIVIVTKQDVINNLEPITTQILSDLLSSTFQTAIDNNQLIRSLDDVCQKWVNGPLKNSIVCTDFSRGVTHWKDGDYHNMPIKDIKCEKLSTKLSEAINTEVVNLIDTSINNISALQAQYGDNLEVIEELIQSIGILQRIKFKVTKQLGLAIAKNAPIIDQKMNEMNLNNNIDQSVDDNDI